MAFPTSPTDGQTAIVNSVTYQYANSTNAWTRILSTANIITANTIAVNGNISAAGNVSGTYVAGTLTTSNQLNITNLGNLISLTVSNSSGTVNFSNTANVTLGSVSNLHISGGTANYVLATNGSGSLSWAPQSEALTVVVDDFTGDGSTTVYTLSVTPGNINDTTVNYNGAILLRTSYSLSVANITFSSPPEDQAEIEVTTIGGSFSGGGGTPGGSNTQVQFNDATVFGGSAAFTFNKTSNILSLTGNIVSGNLLTGGLVSATGNITSAANVSGGNLQTAGVISAGGQIAIASVTGNSVSTTGNIAGGFIFGNGALLTGVITSVANINNGTSNVTVVSSGGNVTVGIGGTGNVAVFATTGEYITGLLSATGNITGGNILTAGLISATGNGTFGNLTTSGTGGDLTGANIISGNTISGSSNVIGGNILTAGYVSATGNITANTASFFIGNGSLLTGIAVSSYGNANVVANLAALGTNPVSTTGNITGGNLLTGGLISATGSLTIANANADIGTTTANSTYNFGTGVTPAGNTKNINIGTAGAASSNTIITIGTALGTGNVTFPANTTVVIANIGGLALSAAGNITGGNLRTAGIISAGGQIAIASVTGNSVSTTGNIAGSFIFGNGALLTGISSSSANISNGTSNVSVVSSGGNVTVGIGGTANVAVFATTGEYITGLLSVSGNITAAGANADIGTTTANSTYNIGAGVTPLGNTKNINIGTAGAASSNTIITIGTALGTGNVTFPANTTVVISNIGGLALSAAGNITGGNLLTGGLISAAGNITGTVTSSRINPRTSSTASTASLTPDISAFDQYNLTALAANVTINAPTGTPVDGNKLMFRILDNGVTRTLTWNATYTVIGVSLPVATTVNKMTYVGCIYNSTNTRWDVLAVGTQT